MIVGNGLIASAFKDFSHSDCIIFASGVSNSNCTNMKEFSREKTLIEENLDLVGGRTFIYFSSCALSASDYIKNPYYEHKSLMEETIIKYGCDYLIIRLPQVFGRPGSNSTLINYLYNKITVGEEFVVYNKAYRYLIDIRDVRNLVEAIVNGLDHNLIIDIANPYRYKVTEIVEIMEEICQRKAFYRVSERDDGYYLNLDFMRDFISQHGDDYGFGHNYFRNRFVKYI